MSSPAQISANQANAQRSTGPRTEEGKAVSARNNFRHGFTGTFTVLRCENQEEYDMLLDALRHEHQPSGATETVLIEGMAQALWLSKRAVMLQNETLNRETSGCDDPKQFALYLRYQVTNDRAFHKCLNQLLKLRVEKRKAEIGFESREQKMKEQARREASENRKRDLHKWRVSLAQAQVDNQELRNMRLETPEHRIEGRVQRLLAAEKTA